MSSGIRQAGDALGQDVRHAVRSLRKSPAFTLVAVLTLGLGIGANSAIFTVVDAVTLKGLPYRDAERLVHVWETQARQRTRQVSYPDFKDVQEQAKSFEAVAGYAFDGFTLKTAEGSERLSAARVSASFFPVLGVEPILGRGFSLQEDQPLLKRDVAVISYGLWQRRFAGDAKIIGQKLTLNDDPFTVIGVLPKEFHFARLGDAEVFATLSPSKNAVERRYMHWMWAIARLRDGATTEGANAELAGIAAARAQADVQWHKDTGLRSVPLREALVGPIRPIALGLFAAVGAVLLIACANVANMLLARAMSRKREVGIRMAMGARRGRIALQFLTESVLISLLGGAVGLLWAGWGIRSLVAAIPEAQRQSLPFLRDLQVDPGVLGFTFVVCLITGLIFGLIPALRTSAGRVADTLKDGARGSSGRGRLRSTQVVAEIALALTLVAATGLLARSLTRLLDVNPGFETAHLLTASLTVPGVRYDTAEKLDAFFERWLGQVRSLPGVSGAALVDRLPLLGSGNTGTPALAGVAADANAPDAELRTVSEEYFQVMGLPVVAGRTFSGSDRASAPRVIVVNQALVDEVFKGRSPLGQPVTFTFVQGELEVVGVVANEKVGALDAEVRPAVYFPFRQDLGNSMSAVVRTRNDPRTLVGLVRTESLALEPEAVVTGVRTMDEIISSVPATFLRRYPLLILGFFAGLALLLAAIGIYGVMALSVSERTSEIGIRMALGAPAGGVQGLILRQGLKLALLGVALGLAAGLATSRVLSSVLFETPPTDPLVFGSAAVLLIAVASLASWIPARRASRVDPLVAVRHD
ncbi:MAG: ABC transporter permease, partial [Vicinamibacteria bacterium]